tara:strand:- start:136 stop:315 length:180 start_codon:yes stop_codon:yes gene_type:complete
MSKGLKFLFILAIPVLLALEFTVVLTSSSLLFELVGSCAVFFTIFLDVVYLATRKNKGE